MDSTFNIILCNSRDKTAWNQALKGIDVSVYFTWEYISILEANYPNGIQLLKIHNNSSGLIAIYSKRSKNQISYDIFSPYALDGVHIWGKTDEVISEFVGYLANNKIVTYYLTSHPGFQYTEIPIFAPYRTIYTLNLTQDSSVLWRNLNVNHRYEINKFSKQNYEIITNKAQLKAPLVDLYRETFERVNANNAYNFNSKYLNTLLDSDVTYASGALIDAKIECVIIILIKNNWAEYYINASSNIGRNATRALIWSAILELKEIGIKFLNLGGGIHENDNLDQFKKKFGGTKSSLFLFKGIASSTEFEKLCNEFNVSTETTNYFPPYWVNNN